MSPCDLIDNYLCSNSPCDCDEPDLSCGEECSTTDGCSQCVSNDYFLASNDHKCVHCGEFFGDKCLHCTNFLGCQQCDNDCQRVEDPDCGL